MAASRAPSETLRTTFDTRYVWEYGIEQEDLRALYEKGKREQWNAEDALDWKTEVDPEAENLPDYTIGIYGSEYWTRLTEPEVRRLRREAYSWLLSQFLHGEQGALLATSQLVSAVPSTDAKFYASTQVVDEARHVEVYHRYLSTKVERVYPVDANLKSLLDVILKDERWDMKYLGMQIMVEGLALSAFGLIHGWAQEPLIKALVSLVMKDEARHVAFGVIALKDTYRDMSAAELRDREDFAYESAVLMRDRFLPTAVWERMGMPARECDALISESMTMQEFRKLLFSKIVPNLKRLGLLTPRMRERMAALGVLHYENGE